MLPVDSGVHIQRELRGFAVVVTVFGEIDLASGPTLNTEIATASALATPPAPVVLDLTRVEYFSSDGLTLLAHHHEVCARHRTPLRVVATTAPVLRPISLTDLDRTIAVFDSVTEALSLPPTPRDGSRR
ncbi:anti-sigma factor antagonist [Allokutzneria sp. A3M-2-11 16]|uniref:anti-sigma factor antagonist n=1 Tax=Allokutzneria sp. A3M-2-11 16 TaxID=2962043 RepID=UPI0020B71E7F|nr:anti-sigma factor antagonist [Allokutzneria sp. A3M-2-11 16]MCP3803962.1 anti-sigma factor antagonist [Allokutzneria sp. A3M-2-11 16]